MANDQSTSTVPNSNLLMALFSRKAIKTLQEKVVLYQLADKYPLPNASGKSMTFSAWRKITAASSTLSEYHASANSAVTLSSRKVVATIADYGRHCKISTDLNDESIIPVMDGAVRELTQSAKLSLDNALQLAAFVNQLSHVGSRAKTTILSAWMSANPSGMCADTGNHTTATDSQFGFPVVFGSSAVALKDINASAASISARMGPIAIRKAVGRLKRLAAEPFEGGFVMITHPYAITSMFGNPAYQSWVQGFVDGPRESMYPGEILHRIHGCRVVESQNVPFYRKAAATCALSANLSLILGQGALAVTELGSGLEIIVKRSGAESTNDPYDLLNTVAYKLRAAGAVLDPSSGVILITVDDSKYAG